MVSKEWGDEKLIWEPGEYNGLEVMRIPCRKIWLPDIVLYNRYMHNHQHRQHAVIIEFRISKKLCY